MAFGESLRDNRPMTDGTTRQWFDVASEGFLAVAGQVRRDQLDRPGLGEWDVRSLLGHAARAFATIETYLGQPAGDDARVDSAADYFRAARAGLADPAAVTERGRDAGRALGDDPGTAVAELGQRVRALVADTSDDTVLGTPVGPMRLIDYLPTRAFELTVHGIDLARAIGLPLPGELASAARPALRLCFDIADDDLAAPLLMAPTGRQPLPDGFSVL